MSNESKPKLLRWLHGEIKTPPFSGAARLEVGQLLRRLQNGESIGLPHSRPMPLTIGPRCHELRVNDKTATWRVIYRLDKGFILIVEIFSKKTESTPKKVISACRGRLKDYDAK